MGAHGLKIYVKVYNKDSFVDHVTYVLKEGANKLDPIDVLREVSRKIPMKHDKLKTFWYWNASGREIKEARLVVLGLKK